jgi:MFS family permease
VAAIVLFTTNGLVVGGYAATLPALRAKLDLDTTLIAILLVCAGIAGIVGMQFSGRLTDALGARRVCLTTFPVLTIGILTIALAPVYPVALVGAALTGLGNGAVDVAMNALGVQVERAHARLYMNRFHGTWSIGNFVGAAIVLPVSIAVGSTGAGIVTPVGVIVAGVLAVSVTVAWRITPETAIVRHVDARGRKTSIPRAAYLLGLMAIVFGLAEGTGSDWSALHVTDVAGVPASVGSMGLVAMTGFMVVIRLLGDRLVALFGRRAIVRAGGVFAVAGYLVVATLEPLPLLLVGWALVGFGVGMLAPQIYAAAGHMAGGRGLAVVVTFGYATFLAGPAFTGTLVNALGIAHAMFVPAILCIGLPLLAGLLPEDGGRPEAPVPDA